MKGYSKINENNNSFMQRSKSNKEFTIHDKDFDSLTTNKKSHLVHQQKSSIPNQINSKKKVQFILEKPKSGEKTWGALRKNFSVSSVTSSYLKNNNGSFIERQSSRRAIQDALKRAFSVKRNSSVNYDKYCRIYDQPNMSFDDYDNNDYVNDDDVKGYNDHQDDFERIKKNNHHNRGRKYVGSNVVRACKRLFSH